MASNNKLRTHKIKRNESKKRKLEAFLELVRQDLSEPLPKKKPPKTFEQSYKALKDELKKYQVKKSPNPLISLKNDGRNAIINLSMEEKISNCSEPLFIEDVHHLLSTSVLGNLSPYSPSWAKIQNAHNVSKTVFLEIRGLSQSDIFKMQSKFNEDHCVFSFVIEVLSSNVPLPLDLSTLHCVIDFSKECKQNYPTDPIDGDTTVGSRNSVSKLHLLLSPIQLAMEHFPLPQSVFEQSKSEGYCFSKEAYTPVSENSPIFGVDCEMCRTTTGNQEVTRVAIVDENLQTVYDTLVKPKNRIIDYLTRYSGITEKMLRNVTTTLEDVHKDMRKILPSDAILCGQSLHNDLHGLKMIHPYVIDTSVLFNESGVRQKKTSLKKLVQIHLKEVIQEGKNGHHPVEDSIAAMKLVQLKLKKSVEYGDAVLCENSEENGSMNDVGGSSIPCTVEKSLESLELAKADSGSNGFFSILSRFSKKVCLIGSEDSLSSYPEMVKDNASLIIKSKFKKVVKATSECVQNHDLILSHLTLKEESFSFEEFSEELQQLYGNIPNNTVFFIFVSNANNVTEEKFKKNYCMITVKQDKPVSNGD